MAGFSVDDATVDGYDAVRLATGDDALSATFCPRAGMIGCSLRHAGDELLGQRQGTAAYAERGSTMGIPLLHPWANRLAAFEGSIAGREVVLDPSSSLVHIDGATGLPIHGLLAASPYWEDVTADAGADGARISSRLDFGAHRELMDVFPFPHLVELRIELSADTLTIETRVSATSDAAVPVSFGFHPYLRLPGVPRREWQVGLPVGRRLLLDERMIPTGETEDAGELSGPLGERTFDDGYAELLSPPVFSVAGGGRRVDVEFVEGYPFAQVYAPANDDVVCFEPMTAPTNALFSGEHPSAEPGRPYVAAFSVRVR